MDTAKNRDEQARKNLQVAIEAHGLDPNSAEGKWLWGDYHHSRATNPRSRARLFLLLPMVAFLVVRLAGGLRGTDFLLRRIEDFLRPARFHERERGLEAALRVGGLVRFVVVRGVDHIVRDLRGLLECRRQSLGALGVVHLHLVPQRVRREVDGFRPSGHAIQLLRGKRRVDLLAGGRSSVIMPTSVATVTVPMRR